MVRIKGLVASARLVSLSCCDGCTIADFPNLSTLFCKKILRTQNSGPYVDKYAKEYIMREMNWTQMILDLETHGYKLQQIADICGFGSKGHLHDLKAGRQKTVTYLPGAALVKLHKKTTRSKKAGK